MRVSAAHRLWATSRTAVRFISRHRGPQMSCPDQEPIRGPGRALRLDCSPISRRDRRCEFDVATGLVPYFFDRNARRPFDGLQAGWRDIEHTQIADDAVDYTLAGERQRALPQDLVFAVLGAVLHQYNHAC